METNINFTPQAVADRILKLRQGGASNWELEYWEDIESRMASGEFSVREPNRVPQRLPDISRIVK